MIINKVNNGSELCISCAGRLDTSTAVQLDSEVKQSLADVTTLVFDFAALEYISSAGLRVLLSTQKIMNKQGKMIVRHANETVLEVFEVTGFTDILTIE